MTARRQLRPTASRDGEPRLTVYVKHRVAHGTVGDALACARYNGWVPERPIGADRALTVVREHLTRGLYYWREAVGGYDEEGRDEEALARAAAADEWAATQLERLWPAAHDA